MKLLFENWRQYLDENENAIYYWQAKGTWEGGLGVSVPKAIPRETIVEDIFEKIRKIKFPDRPSRLNCVFLCENLEGFGGGSYCTDKKEDIGGNSIKTYEVKLRGNPKIFKTNSEIWTKARELHNNGASEERIQDTAESYWNPQSYITLGEILVSPPEAVIIVGRHE